MTGKPEFDPDAFVRAVRQVFHETPEEFQYEPPIGDSCVYIHEGAPSCLFGKALHKLGVRIPSHCEGNSIRGVILALFKATEGEVYSTTGDVKAVLAAASEAQMAQDALAKYSYVCRTFENTLLREGYRK